MTKEAFIDGLKSLTEIVQSLYLDMIQDPKGYGLLLVEDIDYGKYNPKAASSGQSAYRLVSTLHTMVRFGTLSGDGITVDRKLFTETCKKLKMYSISNSNMIFSKLCDFGFIIQNFNGKTLDKNSDTFTILYPDDNNIIPALFGYMANTPLRKHAIFSLNYFLAIPQEEWPEDLHQTIFSAYLSSSDQEFYAGINKHLMSQGLIVGNSDDYSSISFRVEYLLTLKATSRLVACLTNNKKLRILLRLRNIDAYTQYLETVPESVKSLVRTQSTCRNCQENCAMLNTWTFQGITYEACAYQQYFEISSYDVSDVGYYNEIITREIAAAKNKKKGSRTTLVEK